MKKHILSPKPLYLLLGLLVLGVTTATYLQYVDAAATNVVGLQARDNGCGSGSGSARYASDVGAWTSWAGDDDDYDPDCIRLYVGNTIPIDTDIRIGLQARDVNTPCGFLFLFKCGDGGGTIQYGPWLSAWTAKDYTNTWTPWTCDKDCFDADQYRIVVQTQPRYGYTVSDFKLGLQVGDMGSSEFTVNSGCTDHIGTAVYTASSTASAAWSAWANDGYNIQDFNCIRVNLIATSTLNDPTAAFTGTSTVPYGNSVNLTWNVDYIDTTTGCTLSAPGDTERPTIKTNGAGSTTTIPITTSTTYTLTCPGFKTGTTAIATRTLTPISQPATLEFKMSPTSGISPGGTSVATISARNASSCTLKGYDTNYNVVDAGYTFTPPPPSAEVAAPLTTDTYTLTSGTSWTVPADWNSSNNTITLWGGGGGGGGDGGGAAGSAGTATIFNSTMSAGGGGGGASGSGGTPGGTGGTASGGNTTNTNGTAGTAATATSGGAGGASPNGGAGGATVTTNSVGNAGISPGGGGGGGCNGCSGTGGAGGGGGAYVQSTNVTLTPGAAITYQIGAGGAGGSGTKVGGAGAAGQIEITNTHAQQYTVTLTSGTTWTVPSDWSSTNTIEVIGGGGGGAGGASGRGGAGGGAYSKITNTAALTAGSVVTIAVGTGGTSDTAGGDTYLCSSTSNCSAITGSAVIVGAKGGSAGGAGTGAGGQSTEGVGAIKYSGGTGGDATSSGGAGGGGAGGVNGAGKNGGNSSHPEAGGGGANGGGGNGRNADADGGCWAGCGGTGGQIYGYTFSSCKGTGSNSRGSGCMGDGSRGGLGSNGGGGGGGDDDNSTWRGGHGGNGIDLDGSIGSGGGGGGGGQNGSSGTVGGNGGLYGGGGGGASGTSAGGTGGNGVIYITYTAGSSVADNIEAQTSSHTVNQTTNFVVSCIPYDGSGTIYATSTVSMTSCLLDGVTINNGGSSNFYSQSVAPSGHTCSEYGPIVRGCTNGVLTGNSSAVYASCIDQSDIIITANGISGAASVRKGTAIALSWNGGNADSCTVTGTDGFSGVDTDGTTPIVATTTVTINQKTIYTARCTLGGSSRQASVTVNILPTFINQ